MLLEIVLARREPVIGGNTAASCLANLAADLRATKEYLKRRLRISQRMQSKKRTDRFNLLVAILRLFLRANDAILDLRLTAPILPSSPTH